MPTISADYAQDDLSSPTPSGNFVEPTRERILKGVWEINDEEANAYAEACYYTSWDAWDGGYDATYDGLVAIAEKEGEEEQDEYDQYYDDLDYYVDGYDEEYAANRLSGGGSGKAANKVRVVRFDDGGEPSNSRQQGENLDKEAKHRRKVRKAINSLGQQVQDLWEKVEEMKGREKEGGAGEGSRKQAGKRKAQDQDQGGNRDRKKLRFSFEISWSGVSASSSSEEDEE